MQLLIPDVFHTSLTTAVHLAWQGPGFTQVHSNGNLAHSQLRHADKPNGTLDDLLRGHLH